MCTTSAAGTAGTFAAANMDQSAYDREETSLITRLTMAAAGANTGKERWSVLREYVVENEFVKAVRKAGGVAYKLTSQTANGLPDRLVLFFPAKTVFVELKAPGKMLRPLQRKRRYQLMQLGFPVLCIDRLSQIKPAIEAILVWSPGEPFPEGIGAEVPELEITTLPSEQGSLDDLDDYGDTLEVEDPSELAGFYALDDPSDSDE